LSITPFNNLIAIITPKGVKICGKQPYSAQLSTIRSQAKVQVFKPEIQCRCALPLRDDARLIGKNLIPPAGSEIRGKRPHSAQKSRDSTGQWTDARNSTAQVTNTHLKVVLVAISIPIFTSQLEKAREATDLANLRAAYAADVAEVLDNEPSQDTTWVYTTAAKLAASGTAITGKASQTGFQGPNPGLGWTTYTGEAKDKSFQIKYTASTKTINVNFG
jgi:hypothetical protein